MDIAITGASGNVGSAVLRRFGADTGPDGARRHRLLGISRRAPRAGGEPVTDEWLETDLSDPGRVAALTEALRGRDTVIHLAWKIQPSRDEAELRATNVDGSRHLFQAAVDAGVKHIVVASSVGAYSTGPKDDVVDESWPTAGIPTSSYSRHKAAVERLLDDLERARPDVTVSRLRPGLVFQGNAASEISRLFLGPFVPRVLLGRLHLPVLPLPKELVFQAVHADDVADAFWTVVTKQAPGAFNVAAEPVLTPRELARGLGARSAVPLPLSVLRGLAAASWYVHVQPTDAGWIDLAAGVPLMSSLRLHDLGWDPQHTSVEAMDELFAGMRGRRGDDRYPPLQSAGRSA